MILGKVDKSTDIDMADLDHLCQQKPLLVTKD